jgi:hypothetical protein
MSNIKLYNCDVTTVTYSATASDVLYPTTNLNSFFASDIWKGANANNGQQLALSFPLAGKTFVIIDGSNIQAMIDSGATIKLQRAADAGFSTNLETVKNFSTEGFTKLTTFAASNRQYWRIYYENTASAIPYVGNFLIGIEVDLGMPYAYPYIPGLKDFPASEGSSISGRLYTSLTNTGGRQYWKLPLKVMDTTVQNYFTSFFNTVRGKGMPFYFLDTDGTTLNLVIFDMTRNPLTITQVLFADGEILMKSIEVS